MSSRQRRRTAFARTQKQYRITSDDEEDSREDDEESKDSSTKFGGVLASLQNKKLPDNGSCSKQRTSRLAKFTHKKTTATKGRRNNKIFTPERPIESHYEETPPPSSVIVKQNTNTKGVSPLTDQKATRKVNKNNNPKQKGKKGNDYESSISTSSSESSYIVQKKVSKKRNEQARQQKSTKKQIIEESEFDSYSSDGNDDSVSVETDDDDDQTRGVSSDNKETTRGEEEPESLFSRSSSETLSEDEESDEMEITSGNEEDVEDEDPQSSDEEFEFEDEEFVPEDEDASSAEESSEDDLDDFIVPESPPLRKWPQRKAAQKSAEKNKAIAAMETKIKTKSAKVQSETKKTATSKSDLQEHNAHINLCSSEKTLTEKTSTLHENEEEQTESSRLLERIQVSTVDEKNSSRGRTPKQSLSPKGKEPSDPFSPSVLVDTPTTPTDFKEQPSICGDSVSTSLSNQFHAPPLEDSYSIGSNGEDTEIEETPAKPQLPRKVFDFDSPEPQMAIIIDDDDDVEVDLDDGLIVTIVEDNENPQKSIREKNTKDSGSKIMPKPVDENKMQLNEDKISNNSDEKDAKSLASSQHLLNKDAKDERQHSSPETKCSESKKESESTFSSKLLSTKEDPDSYFRQEGTVKRGKWTLGARIGVGSFGQVHIGMNTHTGVLMAIKKFSMQGAIMKDIRREVELMRSLKHINIVRYYGAQMDKNHLHIFQEWVPGGSVSSLLNKFGPFSIEVIRSYLFQILSGLIYLHQNDVIHRDIKGSNALVSDEGVVKLADFGASKKLANLQDNLMMSMTVRGTPYFMAPEVFEEKYSSKADIWGIGCVAFQMVTGRAPWKDKGLTNPISLFNFIKNHDGPPVMEHPDHDLFSRQQNASWQLFEQLVQKCFEHDPSKRPTAMELQNDPFFLTVHDDDDEEATECRGLFSPETEKKLRSFHDDTQNSSMTSMLLDDKEKHELSPSRSTQQSTHGKLHRSKSVVQWKTSFLSPPRPRKKPDRGSPSPQKITPKRTPRRGSQYLSPSLDTREWPEWAKAQLKKEMIPGISPIAKDETGEISNLMGSLALSEDSEGTATSAIKRKRPSTIGTATGSSQLLGLKFLDNSNPTFEI